MEHVVKRRRLGPFSVAPIGFGAMRLPGANVFGPPRDHGAAIRDLREADGTRGRPHRHRAVLRPEHRQRAHPRSIASLSTRADPREQGRCAPRCEGGVLADDEPRQLRRAIEANLRTLGVATLPVVNLRLMRNEEPDAFFDDQLAAMISPRRRLDRFDRFQQLSSRTCCAHAGDGHRLRAKHLPRHEPCITPGARRVHAAGDRVVPFGSLGFGVTGPDAVLRRGEVVEQATRLGVTPAQLVLAWALALAPNGC